MTSFDRGKVQFFGHSAQFNGGSSVHLSHDTPAMHGNSAFTHTEHGARSFQEVGCPKLDNWDPRASSVAENPLHWQMPPHGARRFLASAASPHASQDHHQ